VTGDEERRGIVCGSLPDMSEGKGGASATRQDSTALGDTSVEMG